MAKRRHCDFCGEDERKMRTVTMHVDGRRRARWRLCRICCAVLLVNLTAARRR